MTLVDHHLCLEYWCILNTSERTADHLTSTASTWTICIFNILWWMICMRWTRSIGRCVFWRWREAANRRGKDQRDGKCWIQEMDFISVWIVWLLLLQRSGRFVLHLFDSYCLMSRRFLKNVIDIMKGFNLHIFCGLAWETEINKYTT